VARTRYARSGDLRIAYELRGSPRLQRPSLILVQGMGFDRTGWGPAIRLLQRRFRLVLIDNRGSGGSTANVASFGISEMAADVVAVLDDIGLPAAHLLGASLGGMIAQELAIDYPDRVDGLVLACTTPGLPFGYPMPAEWVGLIAATSRMAPAAALRRHVEIALSTATVDNRPELVEQIIARQRLEAGGDPSARQAQATAGARYVGSFRQQRIRARTLILHGEADRVVDPRNAGLLARRIAGADLVIFPGLGHLFFWEDPAGFAAAVTSFLRGGSERDRVA
jgi:3-oxoadipate enol-lactonase